MISNYYQAMIIKNSFWFEYKFEVNELLLRLALQRQLLLIIFEFQIIDEFNGQLNQPESTQNAYETINCDCHLL